MPSPIFDLISPLYAAIGALALLVVSAFVLGRLRRLRVPLNVRRRGLVFSVTALLTAHGLGWLSLQSLRQQTDRDELRIVNDVLVDDALVYLAQRCASERRLVVGPAHPVAPGEGVLVDIAPARRLALGEVPPPTAETPRMRELQSRLGEMYPQRQNERQYRLPVDWFEHVGASDVLGASLFAFVEQDRRDSPRAAITATARRLWWESTGGALLLPASKDEFLARLVQADLLQWLEGPVRESSARYLLTARDTSTAEDRRHWVARAQMRLIDRRSGALVAEYVGFAANLAPVYEPREGFAWQDSRVCPGPEQRFKRGSAPFDAIGFFLAHGVRFAEEPVGRTA